MILMGPIQIEVFYESMILYQTINKQGLSSSFRSRRNFKNGKRLNNVMKHNIYFSNISFVVCETCHKNKGMKENRQVTYK